MPTPFLLIDGYNLLHAADLARQRYGPGALQSARKQLQGLLAGLLSEEAQQRTTIVYDAYNSPSNDRRLQRHGSIAIRFAPQGGDADTEIEQLIRQHSAPRQLIVVSSDHRLHKAARRRRARCVDSERFLADLQRTEPAEPELKKPDPELPAPDSQHTKPISSDEQSAAKLQQWVSDTARQQTETPFSDDYLDGLQRQIDEQQRRRPRQ